MKHVGLSSITNPKLIRGKPGLGHASSGKFRPSENVSDAILAVRGMLAIVLYLQFNPLTEKGVALPRHSGMRALRLGAS